MLTRIGGSRIPWVIRSSSLTDSTVSSPTSRSKRHCDLPHEDDHSDGPPPRSRYVSTDPHLIRLGVSFPLRKDQQRREATTDTASAARTRILIDASGKPYSDLFRVTSGCG
ncbi:hypothetical protein PIB30_052332 [Stylosanthes scabra]|uniref:Uncharacterized protein n=1 Tax=Stylosanthes scabra TaxID=79078 RepID=A0ABU6XH45_9FABA|nr:hypothetical protein [Stylosanthes scabra]